MLSCRTHKLNMPSFYTRRNKGKASPGLLARNPTWRSTYEQPPTTLKAGANGYTTSQREKALSSFGNQILKLQPQTQFPKTFHSFHEETSPRTTVNRSKNVITWLNIDLQLCSVHKNSTFMPWYFYQTHTHTHTIFSLHFLENHKIKNL